jgi:hypothetical protein
VAAALQQAHADAARQAERRLLSSDTDAAINMEQ